MIMEKLEMRMLIICSLLIVAVASVSYTQPASEKVNVSFVTQDDKATVHIYRSKNIYGSALEKSVFLDGVEIARIDSGRFITLKLDAGKHRVHMADEKLGLEVEMKGGQEYYFRLKLVQGWFGAHGRLVAVDNEKGAKEMKKLKPVNADKIKDDSKVVTHP